MDNTKEIVLGTKSILKTVNVIFIIIWIIVLWSIREYITSLNAVAIGITAIILLGITVPVLSFIRKQDSKKIVIRKQDMLLVSGKSARTVPFEDVVSLEKRKVKIGGNNTVAGYFARFKDDKSVLLLLERSRPDQEEVLESISQRMNKEWKDHTNE